MYKIEKINKKFGSYKALNEIDLDIPKNRLSSIIGPNGAGKSSLLGVISRILKADSGDVFLEDKNIKEWETNSLAKTMSIMKQLNNINIRLTINDLVSFGRYPYSKDRLKEEDYRVINSALDYTGLKDIKDKYLDELSGGQRQRAYIAMILAQDTEYILLDEPLNNLDIKHILEVMRLLKKLVLEKNKTIILVIHDINIASSFSDYIIAMKQGRVVETGIPEKIIDNRVLKNIYDIEFNIENINNKKICLYY